MFPYYCVEGSDVQDKVVMMRGYVERDWAVLRTEMLDAFRLAESRSREIIYRRRYLEDLCAEFEGRDDTETLKSFLCTYDHISGVVTECKGAYTCVWPHRYTYGYYRNTVANVDASDSRCRCIGKIITRDLRLVAS